MTDRTPKIIGYGGPGVGGAAVLGATWEDEPATLPAPQAAPADDTQATTGAQRQEESTR